MGFYSLVVLSLDGSGQITLSPASNYGFYQSGDSITVSITPGSGFTFLNWKEGTTIVSTSSSFSYTMPDRDVILIAYLSGTATTPSNYGLKYFYEYCPVSGYQRGKKTRIEIEEKDYLGAADNRKIGMVTFRVGNDNSNLLEPIIGSSLDMSLAVYNNVEYEELLDSDPKKFRVNYYQNYVNSTTYDFKWTGFIITDVLEKPDFSSVYLMDITATDGLKTLDSRLLILESVTGLRLPQLISSILRQDFPDPLNLVENIQVHETRMDDTLSSLNQISINSQRLYKDDTIAFFDDSGIQYNQAIDLKTALIRAVKSFVARVYQWNEKWYVQRLMELDKDTLVFNEFDNEGTFIEKTSLFNSQELNCNLLDKPRISGQLAYTEVNASLQLGEITVPTLNEIFVENFDLRSWFYTSSNGWKLNRWKYIRIIPFDGVRDNEIARLEFVSNPTSGESGVFARFWGTANTVSDANISYIEYDSSTSPLSINQIAVEAANKISVGAKFQILRRSSSDPSVPVLLSHSVAIQVQIGSKYLIESSPNVFTWTSTPTLVTFPVNNSGVFNTIQISDVDVPETGSVVFRLYQLITNVGTRHRYVVDWDDAYIALSQNDSLTNESIIVKGTSDTPFPNVLETYETFLGDALTNLSASAFKLQDLTGNPVTENWSRDGVESLPLLNIIVQDLANLFIKKNYRARMAYYGNIDFRKSVQYDGYNWIINSATLDDYSGRWELDLFRLNLVTT